MILCGIDEAGRGPLAGSLVLMGVILHRDVKGLRDSKKLSEAKREMLYTEIVQNADYHMARFSAKEIDERGMSHCMKTGLEAIQTTLKADRYLFDGNTTFGVHNLETLVKADDKVPEVAAASILAKVHRDREMIAFSKVYPDYGFEEHKGYATPLHVSRIKEHGYCNIHRRSFRIKALEPTLFD